MTAGQDTDILPILMGQPPGPIAGDAPPSSWTTGEPPPIAIGGLPYPVTPSRASTPTLTAPRRAMWIMMWVALITFTGLGAVLLLMGTSGQAEPHAALTGPPRAGSNGASHPALTRQPAPNHSARSHRPTRLAPASRRSGQALIPANIAAFGPGGVGQGDNPQLARQALAGKAAAPWHSAWYATPHFGNLQRGTGLLLDMGRTVTITTARITLGNSRGANLTLRIGNSPALASLRPVAHMHHAAGVVQLTTTPASGRYVLVWFTKLPPGHAGTFQVSVYDITLRGYR